MQYADMAEISYNGGWGIDWNRNIIQKISRSKQYKEREPK